MWLQIAPVSGVSNWMPQSRKKLQVDAELIQLLKTLTPFL
jgi:hypothetical protein